MNPKRTRFKQIETGFTLIELLVVVIIIGILSAVALPSFFNQVRRAREVEAQSNLSAVATTQQTHFVQQGEFADNIAELGVEGDAQYFTYQDLNIGEVNGNPQVTHFANALDPERDNVRNYAQRIFFEDGAFGVVLCRGEEPGVEVTLSELQLNECEQGIRIE